MHKILMVWLKSKKKEINCFLDQEIGQIKELRCCGTWFTISFRKDSTMLFYLSFCSLLPFLGMNTHFLLIHLKFATDSCLHSYLNDQSSFRTSFLF